MKKNKYIKIVLLVILALLFIVFIFQYLNTISSTDIRNESILVNTTPSVDLKNSSDKSVKSPPNKIIDKVETVDEAVKVVISVKDKAYHVSLKDGSSIYDAMVKLSKENNDFVFTSKDYSGMGMFIDSINGTPNSFEKNWIYYVNDKKASIGVSKNLLKNGDIVRWNQEGFIN